MVRFYGQRIDNTTNSRTPVGPSFFIGETALAPLPGFNSARFPGAPNWARASVDFDTTGYADQDLIFFVVVYAVTEDGEMVEELPGYGLSEPPPFNPELVTSIGDVAIEMVEIFDNTGGSTPSSFTNNVAYYHRLLYVEPSLTSRSDFDGAEREGELVLESFELSVMETRLGEPVIIAADFRSYYQRNIGTEVVFYDGDPKAAASRVIDWEHIPIIRANLTARAQVPYATAECGRHSIYVVADNGSGAEPVSDVLELNVPCEIDVLDGKGVLVNAKSR